MAKIVQFSEFGGPEVLQLNEVELSDPGDGEVKLAVKAIGLNRAETMLRQNEYIFTPDLPSKLGYDASAEVIAVGPNVSGLSIGDKVITIPSFSQSKNGVYGEEALVPANACWPWPEGLVPSRPIVRRVDVVTVQLVEEANESDASRPSPPQRASSNAIMFAPK